MPERKRGKKERERDRNQNKKEKDGSVHNTFRNKSWLMFKKLSFILKQED